MPPKYTKNGDLPPKDIKITIITFYHHFISQKDILAKKEECDLRIKQ